MPWYVEREWEIIGQRHLLDDFKELEMDLTASFEVSSGGRVYGEHREGQGEYHA